MIRFSLTENDVAQASDIWRRARVGLWRPALLAPLVFGAGILLFYQIEPAATLMQASLFAAIIALASTAGGLLAGKILGRRKSVSWFRQTPTNHEPMEVTWTPDHLTVSQPSGHYSRTWKDFTQWSESDGVFVLLLAGPLFLALPKRAMTPGEQESLRRTILDAGIAKARLLPF